ADRNRSHWSTSKTPSYTKSVSWQHHPISHNIKVLLPFSGCGQLWDIAYNLHYHTCHSMPCLTPLTLFGQD
ncbi:hypothetical protein ACLEVY_23410, partial [Escherichia coli]